MIATSKLRRSGPYRPGWVRSWLYQANVKVPVLRNTLGVKLKATTVASGPRTNKPNKNQTNIVQRMLSRLGRRHFHFTATSPPTASGSSSPDDVLREVRFQAGPLRPIVRDVRRTRRRQRNPTARVGEARDRGAERESTHVPLDVVAEEELNELLRPRILVAVNESRRENDRFHEALTAQQGQIGCDFGALLQIEQRHGLVSEGDAETAIGDAEDVRSGVRRLNDRVCQRLGARGGRKTLEE